MKRPQGVTLSLVECVRVIKILWVILFVSLFVNCLPPISNPFEKEKEYSVLEQLVGPCLAGLGKTDESYYEVEDKNDGTLEVVKHNKTTYCFGLWGTVHRSYGQYFIKKCIQGQVYRSEQNDCKGTGSASDYYGAQKYQWCPTNDTSCNSDLKNSPANATCLNDLTASKGWKPGVGDDTYVQYVLTYQSDEIPTRDSDYYWWSDSGLVDDTEMYAERMQLGTPNEKFLKNTYNYVICRDGYLQ
ncbi:MAG: hypothetical protein KDK90_27725 [Leptospiraceae bacterium]|nr:hypothetical protein [Leptospiraceae bacterium]